VWDSEVGVRMVREYWKIEERHEAFQKDSAAEFGVNIPPLCEIVDLVFTDGMKWKCLARSRLCSLSKKSDANSLTGVWKNPLDPPSSRESSTDTASTSGVTTPAGGWADVVKFGRAQSGRLIVRSRRTQAPLGLLHILSIFSGMSGILHSHHRI
jgi:hypothetical protein